MVDVQGTSLQSCFGLNSRRGISLFLKSRITKNCPCSRGEADADEETTNIAVNVTCVVPVVDHEISRVLMNQATRAYDSLSDASPPFGLVSERELLVRAFVTGSGAAPQAQVIISRQGQADQSFPMQVPASISDPPASELLLAASHYAVIPAAA